MQRQVFEIHFAHQRPQCAVNLGHFTGRGMNGDAEKIEFLAGSVIIGLVAKNVIHVFGNDVVEKPCCCGPHSAMKPGRFFADDADTARSSKVNTTVMPLRVQTSRQNAIWSSTDLSFL